jgi:hypothetical protein
MVNPLRHRVCAADRALDAQLFVVGRVIYASFHSKVLRNRSRRPINCRRIGIGPSHCDLFNGQWAWIWHIASKLTDRYPYGPHSEPADQYHTTGLAGFAIYRAYGLNPTVCVPHWFLALAFVGLGGLSWLRWQKRFSLRTLLIATTLVAIALEVIMYAAGN